MNPNQNKSRNSLLLKTCCILSAGRLLDTASELGTAVPAVATAMLKIATLLAGSHHSQHLVGRTRQTARQCGPPCASCLGAFLFWFFFLRPQYFPYLAIFFFLPKLVPVQTKAPFSLVNSSDWAQLSPNVLFIQQTFFKGALIASAGPGVRESWEVRLISFDTVCYFYFYKGESL